MPPRLERPNRGELRLRCLALGVLLWGGCELRGNVLVHAETGPDGGDDWRDAPDAEADASDVEPYDASESADVGPLFSDTGP